MTRSRGVTACRIGKWAGRSVRVSSRVRVSAGLFFERMINLLEWSFLRFPVPSFVGSQDSGMGVAGPVSHSPVMVEPGAAAPGQGPDRIGARSAIV